MRFDGGKTSNLKSWFHPIGATIMVVLTFSVPILPNPKRILPNPKTACFT